jgi:cytochrome bd-type quinol oxidase subunit 2
MKMNKTHLSIQVLMHFRRHMCCIVMVRYLTCELCRCHNWTIFVLCAIELVSTQTKLSASIYPTVAPPSATHVAPLPLSVQPPKAQTQVNAKDHAQPTLSFSYKWLWLNDPFFLSHTLPIYLTYP